MNTLNAIQSTNASPSLKELRLQASSPQASRLNAISGTPPAVYAPYSINAPNLQSPTFGNRLNVMA
jgi:hypothetical protein